MHHNQIRKVHVLKIDSYLLEFLCHVNSDVKFWHVFFSYLHSFSKALFYKVTEIWLLNKHWYFEKQPFIVVL